MAANDKTFEGEPFRESNPAPTATVCDSVTVVAGGRIQRSLGSHYRPRLFTLSGGRREAPLNFAPWGEGATVASDAT